MSAKKIEMTAIHGFLGHPSDWDFLAQQNQDQLHFVYNLHALDLREEWQLTKAEAEEVEQRKAEKLDARNELAGVSEYDYFAAWVRNFCKRSEKNKANQINNANSSSIKRVLIGYSLGGRLALHALCARPDLWAAVVIISAHPGYSPYKLHEFEYQQLVRERLQSDHAWAERFRKAGDSLPWKDEKAVKDWKDWLNLLHDWNSQSVFRYTAEGAFSHAISSQSNRKSPRTPPQPTDALLWAEMLEAWSLGRQSDLQTRLRDRLPQILWITGDEDQKFQRIAEQLQSDLTKTLTSGYQTTLEEDAEFFQHVTIAEAGHRVPWDQPKRFCQTLFNFLRHL